MAVYMEGYFKKACELLKVGKLKDFQKETVVALLGGRDVFLSVQTGAGKSLCFQTYPVVWRQINNEVLCRVLIVTPLISIMKEQCDFLCALGFKSTYIGKDAEDEQDILDGKFDFLFSSPDSLLGVTKWREMLRSNIHLMVVDEAHTVIHWGEADGDDAPFRVLYGKLGEARSLLTCPILLITATASKSARKKLQKKFSMTDCLEIIDNPDRVNIKLFVHKYKSSLSLNILFEFLITFIKENKDKCERYIIFCPSIRLCRQVFTMLRLEIGVDIKYIQMFHSMTTDKVKEEVRQDMGTSDGTIRVLVSTSAAGMGVNFAGVNSVINLGPPKDMDSYVQQFGRCGRDGSQAMALLLFNAKQCKTIDQDMHAYIFNDTMCRRQMLLDAYNGKPSGNLSKHLCCDICAKNCYCNEEDCSKYLHPIYVYDDTILNAYSSSSDSHHSDSDSDY